MANIPTITSKRLISKVPKFKRTLKTAHERDVNEADTVTIVTDILEEVFGFDKYMEITREYAIQGTYCDLAVKVKNKIEYLLEVKAIGVDLKDSHLRQAVNYAAKEGIKWVVLTNAINWEIHRVNVKGKVVNERLFKFDFLDLNPRKQDDQETLFLLCKRGVDKDLIDELYQYRQSINRYTVGAILLTDGVISAVRRELRKLKTGLKVGSDEIKDMISEQVIKRDLIESETAKAANKQIKKALNKHARVHKKKKPSNDTEVI